jgi:choline dehydrogenase-like flavoprotein
MTSSHSYDVIMIDAGAGGGMLARRLAAYGDRSLLLGRGGWLPREPESWQTAEVFVDRALTAMANPMRVGDHLLERLGASAKPAGATPTAGA